MVGSLVVVSALTSSALLFSVRDLKVAQLNVQCSLIRELMVLFTNPSARAGYDTRSIFKRSLTGLNSEFSFS